MKPHQITFAMAILLLMLAGCGRPNSNADTNSSNPVHQHGHEHGQTPEHDHGRGEMAGWVLDDGKKWPVDDHTRKMMQEMQSTVETADLTTVAGRQSTGRTVREQTNKLIAGCTMIGPAHDQLHIFLNEFMPAVNGLATATDPTDSERRAARVRELMKNFGEHFE